MQPFSHIAFKPEEVDEWVLVTFDELHGPMAMDKRSVEALNDKEYTTIHFANLGRRNFIRCIEYKLNFVVSPNQFGGRSDGSVAYIKKPTKRLRARADIAR